ncbi:MAG: 50S ribosomal protein L10 [Patescibacteria group bacterium]|jgi:large subunit ribosomal protein L10
MAKSRAKKNDEVARYADKLAQIKSAIFADLSKLKVNDSNELRRKAEGADVAVVASKKTLLRLALEQAKVTGIDVKTLPGSVSLLLGLSDEVAPAKVLDTFAKTHENVRLLGGLLGSQWMTSEQVTNLAKLPSKEQLIAQVVGTIRAPLSGLVGVMQGNLRQLVYALNAIKDSKSA